jgi:hypothetical protein
MTFPKYLVSLFAPWFKIGEKLGGRGGVWRGGRCCNGYFGGDENQSVLVDVGIICIK